MELRLIQTLVAHHRGAIELTSRPEGGYLPDPAFPVISFTDRRLTMTQRTESGNPVWRFDLSQQFTAMQRISVVLSRATEIGQTLQEYYACCTTMRLCNTG